MNDESYLLQNMSHDNRLKSIFKYATPSKGSEAFVQMNKTMEDAFKRNPKFSKERYKASEEARKQGISIFEAQLLNGAGLAVDNEIRIFSSEFNSRLLIDGINAMPSSFFTMEAFFKHRPDVGILEILEEEDYLFSFKDFIANVATVDFKMDSKVIKESLVEGLIYNFNILNNPEELVFSTEDGIEFVIGGVSIVRRGNEVIIYLLTGLKMDCDEATKELLNDPPIILKGKHNVTIINDNKIEVQKLFNNNSYGKTNAFCRIDIEKNTIDSRFIQRNMGMYVDTTTDDISYLNRIKERLCGTHAEEFIKNQKDDILSYSAVFELATKCLHIPHYFNTNEDLIFEEEHPTELSKERNKASIFKKANIFPNQYKKRNRTVWCLDLQSTNKSDFIYFGDNSFKIEKTGYWQPIDYMSVGKDKNGNPIHGKTWVEKMLTWFEQDKQTLTVNFNPNRNVSKITDNEGYIYIMRNASHDIDIFKIGLTTRDSKTRARELSRTTSSPDKFLVAQEWKVKDCILAEKIIHNKLERYKINNRREYFKIEYNLAIEAIIEVVNTINNENGQKESI